MRLTAEHRRAQIIETARNLSKQGGLYDWTLADIAATLSINRNTVKHYFGSAQYLRAMLIRDAIKARDLDVIVQAIAKYDPAVEHIGRALRMAASKHIGAK